MIFNIAWHGKTMELLEKYVLGLHQSNKSNTERRGIKDKFFYTPSNPC
jgi:hypothetical protein